MPAKTYLGYDPDRGAMAFDLGDGGAPYYAPSSPAAIETAMRSEYLAGRDPNAVLLRGGGAGLPGLTAPAPDLGPLPPRPSAVGPEALAKAPPTTPQSLAEIGQRPPQSLAEIGKSEEPAPDPWRAQWADAEKAAAAARQAAGARVGRDATLNVPGLVAPWQNYKAEGQDTPGAAPAKAPGGLVPTPGAAPAQPGGGPMQLDTSALPAEQEYRRWLREQMARNRTSRPWSQKIPGATTPTAETRQGSYGPDPVLSDRQSTYERLAAQYAAKQEELASDAQLKQAAALEEEKQAQEGAALARAAIDERATKELGGIREQIRGQNARVAAGQVDGGRYWRSQGLGNKILITAAIGLSGAGAAIAGRGGAKNDALDGLLQAVDRDVDEQVKNIDNERRKLTDLQQVYAQTKQTYDDERVAVEATKLAALERVRTGMAAEMARLAASRGQVDLINPETGEVFATDEYAIHARKTMAQAEAKIAEREAALSQALRGAYSRQYVITQDRVVGGGGYDPKKEGALLKELIGLEREGVERGLKTGDLAVKLRPKPGETKTVFVNGQPILAHPDAQSESLKDAQARISYASSLLDDIEAVRRRMKEPGAYAPGDPQAKIDAGALAKSFSRAASNEAASESDKEDFKAAVTPGPRQEAALNRLRQKAMSFQSDALKSVGAKPGAP